MTDKSIDFTKSEQYTLSIRLSTDGFSFSIYNPLGGSDFLIRTHPVNTQHSMAANVKQFLSEAEEVKHPYRQTNILIHNSRYTSVPLELFEDEQMEDIFYQNFPKINNEIVLCNILGKSNMVVLFSMDKLTHLYLNEKFPEARFFSSVSPQIEYLTNRSRQGNNRKLYANIHPQNIDVFCFENGKALLLNTYPTVNVQDRIYYLMNIWEQLKYDQERDEMHLIGEGSECNTMIQTLRRYIRKVFVITPQAEFNQSETNRIEDIPFDIQSLLICE